MHNTGTWDSDLAILFLGCLLLPISMYFLRGFFEAIAAARPIIIVRPPLEKAPAENTHEPPQGVEFTASETWTEPVASKPKKKTAPPLTSQAVETEAISALCNMGYKKGEASKLVKSLSSKTKYDSTESLIKGCFMCIS